MKNRLKLCSVIPSCHHQRNLLDCGYRSYKDINPALNHCSSYIKFDKDGEIVKSAMISLVNSVELDPDYQGHFTMPLYNIRKSFLSLDGLLYSQQKMN